MDDSIIIDESKEKLKHTLKVIKKVCDYYDIELNEKKTIISKNRCNYLKRQFIISDKLITKPMKDSYYRMFRKLKVFFKWYKENKISLENIETSYQSWKSHFLTDNAEILLHKANIKYNSFKENYL